MNDATAARNDTDLRQDFFKKLQTVTTQIHATSNLDEIMLDLGMEFCDLFNCDRFTLYAVGPEKDHIVSKVKTGLTSFRDLQLPINPHSIAGWVALTRRTINIADVYDEDELRRLSSDLHFQRGVDQRTGYRTREMLVAPLVSVQSNELLGVIQFINNRAGGPFPPVCQEGVKELCDTLSVAFSQRLKPPQFVRTKYDGLVADAVLSGPEFELAQRAARKKDLPVEEVLINEFQVKPAAIGAALARFFNVPYEPYKSDRVKPVELLKNLKEQYVEENQWLPLEAGPGGLVVLALDPERVHSSRIVTQIFPKAKVVYRVTTQAEFQLTIDQFFGGAATDTASVGELLSGMEGEEDEEGASENVSEAVENELVKLVNKIIVDAYRQGVSDIHIEPLPGKGKTGIRFRKDGSLVPYIEIPGSYRAALIARIKIMCELDISERRKPQDGKIKFKKFGPLDIELRVATIPSTGGVEDVVMRILAAGEPIPLDKLGVLPFNLARLKSAVEKPYGLFFVCGPTGSGKTTTLHSVLNYLNTPETKIWTAEDPVEITQKGLRQVQVNRKAGLEFSTVMRAFLRADPDIIMVGEMRDKETVSTGIEASLTGHLVFATLHTNSAPESIVRLLDMGMDPFNFADALLGILAQRLAKRLCDCKEAYVPSHEELRGFINEYALDLKNTRAWKDDPGGEAQKLYEQWVETYGQDGQLKFHRAVGCEKCNKSGYKGRVGLHELLVADDEIKRLIQERARVADIFVAAVAGGMRTLKMDGMEKIMIGLTDLKQVRSVCIR
jgi:type II secretory ATPase GspE/PulE/Tfp pilus assembly ATPase PilB-like protein